MGHFTSGVVDASAARTTTGTGTAYKVPEQAGRVSLAVIASAVSGTTPNMVVSLQWSHDNSTWLTADAADTMTALTATGNVVKTFQVKAPYVRAAWTITGTTPSFTFTTQMFFTEA